MSHKRLQILLPEGEYKNLERLSKKLKKTVSHLVRESIDQHLAVISGEDDPHKKLAQILKFSKNQGPTGDIKDILADIEKGMGSLP